MFWKLCSWSRCPYKSLCTGWVRRFSWSPCFQESEFWTCSCRLTWERSTCPSSTFTRLNGYPKFCGGLSLALHGLHNTKLTGLAFAGTIGFGFAMGEPSLEVASWPLFDMALCFPIGSERKMLKWLQENIEKLILLNKRRRWFQSSRGKLSLVNKSASWFWVSTYLIWIFGSKLILSNNQSSATLWVLDTCLIVGLLTFDNHVDDCFVVFKKCTTEVRWWVRNPQLTTAHPLAFSFQFVFWSCFYWWNGLLSRTSLLGLVYFVLQCCVLIVTLQLPCPKDREQAVHPCAIQFPKKWFQTLQTCGILTFVSCTSNWWWQMFGFREYIKSSPEVDFESSRSPAKSESWKKKTVDNAEPWYPHDIIVGIRLCDECMKSILPVVCSILWLLLQVCWQTIECLLSQFVPNISIFKTIREPTWNNSQIDSSCSCLNWWPSKQRLGTLYNCSSFVCQFTVSLNAFSSMSFHVIRPCSRLCVRLFPPW